jgi:hypothetical protein
VQKAYAAALTGMVHSNRERMQELMDEANTEKHHFCMNRECDGTGDGSCGIATNTTTEIDETDRLFGID